MASLSDRLALTHAALADERTLPAYVRTVLTLTADGVGPVVAADGVARLSSRWQRSRPRLRG